MIVCCGEALFDMVPDGERGDLFRARPGGCPYNTAIAASRLGAKVAFLGRLGRDFLGTRLLENLAASGVDVSAVVQSDEGATLAFVSRDGLGNARYAFYSEGAADRSFSAKDLPPVLPRETRFLMIGSISMVEEPLASTVEALAAREARNLLVSFDPNIRPGLIGDREAYLERYGRWLALSALVKASSEDLEWLYPGMPVDEAMDSLLGLGPALVVATLGAQGAVARCASARAAAPAFPVAIADTIGAGDSFHAAILAALDAEGVTTREALSKLDAGRLSGLLCRANAAAALNCGRVGADPPRAAELAAFLEARGVLPLPRKE